MKIKPNKYLKKKNIVKRLGQLLDRRYMNKLLLLLYSLQDYFT